VRNHEPVLGRETTVGGFAKKELGLPGEPNHPKKEGTPRSRKRESEGAEKKNKAEKCRREKTQKTGERLRGEERGSWKKLTGRETR